jgi:hypothetical protein
MAKIFISYSSKDKEFVNKLSYDLLSSGLPVWLDSWEIQLGDSLYDKIFDGLDTSSYILIVVSKNYNKSTWTSKEFKAMLSKEDRENRKIIIPVLIDDSSDIPLQIADRVYKNFATDYNDNFIQLSRFFKRNDVSITSIPIYQRLLPISFDNYVHLDTNILIKLLEDRNSLDVTKFTKKQIWLKDSSLYDSIIACAKKNIEKHKANRPLYTQFKNDLDSIEAVIEFLYTGIITILNEYRTDANIHFVSISLYWLYRQIIERLFSILSRYVDLENEFNIIIEKPILNAFANSSDFCRFYKIEDCRKLDLFDPGNRSDYFGFLVDKNNYALREFDVIHTPDPLSHFWDIDLIYKFLIPQNVFANFYNGRHNKLMTNFKEYYLGLG